ncbi:MAG: hypothetical protein WC365_08105 [Candidatus Babeliales bacterium]|jgi:hypothetical protein
MTHNTIDELLKNSPIPEAAKEFATIGTTLGLKPDSIIHGMDTIINQNLTIQAEKTHPKQPKQPEYTETERTIVDMLTENTGANFLDSGGAYGRSWERNRSIKNFHETPTVTVEIDDYGINIGYNIFHYLRSFLHLTTEAKKLQKEYERYCKKHPNDYEIDNMENFASELGERVNVVNTYNYDTILNGTLQYAYFDYDGNTYILLQIHGGCDVRGGYTDAKIFEVSDIDHFLLAQTDIYANCECGYCMASSDNSGDDWQLDTDDSVEYKDVSNPDKTTETPNTPLQKRLIASQDGKSAICAKCKKPVTFSVNEGY